MTKIAAVLLASVRETPVKRPEAVPTEPPRSSCMGARTAAGSLNSATRSIQLHVAYRIIEPRSNLSDSHP